MNYKVLFNVKRWLGEYIEHCFFIFICIVGLSGLLLALFIHWGPYQGDIDSSSFYLLSSIVQGLAAILALLVTVSVVGSQLAAGAYTPRILRQRLSDFWLWFAVFIYLLAIIWSLFVLSAMGNLSRDIARTDINIALLLAVIALIYIVPFTIATFKNLQPNRVAKWLIEKDDYDSLDELMRKAINDGTITLLINTLNQFSSRAKVNLSKMNGAERKADEISNVFLLIGRHACQRHSPDALEKVINLLTELVAYCNDHPRNWRVAADIFNEAVRELYSYSESLLENI
jgi:hypothetical protein